MASLNKVMLIGRLGRDPELKYSQGGTPITTFSLATDESYTDNQGNRVDKAEWHRIVVFGRQAEPCANYLFKGSQCYVEGSLQTRSWEQDGQTRYMTEVKAQRVQFLDPKGANADRAPQQGYQQGGGQPQGGRGGYNQPQQQGGGYNQGQQQGGYNQGPGPEPDDMGPAFPSEAGGMDDVPF